MAMRRKGVVLLLLAVVFLLGSSSKKPKNIPDPNPMRQHMSQYKYSELMPPINLVPPGTIIELVQRDPHVVNIVCTQQSSLGPITIPESDTYDINLIKSVTGTFSMGANYLSLLKADAQFKAIRNIQMTISNAKILQLSADLVMKNVRYRLPDCQAALEAYLAKNRKVSMVSSVLKADLNYNVDFQTDAGLTVEAQQAILKGLAPKLGIQYSSTEKDSLKGIGIFLGMRDEALWLLFKSDGGVIPAVVVKEKDEAGVMQPKLIIEKERVDKGKGISIGRDPKSFVATFDSAADILDKSNEQVRVLSPSSTVSIGKPGKGVQNR